MDSLIGNFFFDMDDSSDESEDSEDNELVENVEKRKRPTLKPAEVKRRALDVFVPETEYRSEDAVSAYTACIRNHAQLDMIVEYASLGASFRMIEKLANATRKLTGVSKYSGCSQRQVAKVLRVVCASNMQMLLEILGRCWAFSLAFDSATQQSTSYLDLRVRFCFGDNIHNFHVISVPMDGRHTGEEMFEIIVEVLNVIRPGWRESLIGVATDGARNMTGRFSGVVSKIQQCVGPHFVRVWCGAHQLDLVMARTYDKVLHEEFFSTLIALVGYFRRQLNLVEEMNSTCHRVALTRWLSTSKVMRWFKKHRLRLERYLELKKPAFRPTPGTLNIYL